VLSWRVFMKFNFGVDREIRICSDSQAALKALQAVRTTSPLVQQRHKALNDISTRHAVGLYWVPVHAGLRGNDIADELTRDSSALSLLDLSRPWLGVSRLDIQRRITRRLVNQHWVWWRGLGDTQRQARELISGPCLGAKARFLSCNRTQSRAVSGLLTGRNTLRRHLHLIGLSDSPLCRRCGVEDETSAHILCECEALTSLRRVTGLLLLGARGHQEYKSGVNWNFSKATGLP